MESGEKEFDPVKRFRFADEIRLGFIAVFCLSMTERFLSVFARGRSCDEKENTGELPGALIAENPVFRLISCAGGKLWKYFSGGDLIFLIVLCGLAFLALRSLRFVTENSAFSDDRHILLLSWWTENGLGWSPRLKIRVLVAWHPGLCSQGECMSAMRRKGE